MVLRIIHKSYFCPSFLKGVLYFCIKYTPKIVDNHLQYEKSG